MRSVARRDLYLYGAIGGFGAAVLLVIVLIHFHLLKFDLADRQTTDIAVPSQTSSPNFS